MGLFYSNSNILSQAIPSYGIGLSFYYAMDDNYLTSNKLTLYSNDISGSCFVPVTNGAGDNLTLEFAPGASGMTLDLTGTGAGKLDTGTVAAGTFYDVRIISKRDGSAALLAHTSGKLEPGVTGIGGSFTMPAGYSHYSDVVWGFSYTAPAVATFTLSGVPNDGSTITLTDNYTTGSAVTKVFEIDSDSSITGGNVAVDTSAASSGSDVATALVSAINGLGASVFGVTAAHYGGGKVVLWQMTGSAYASSNGGDTAISVNDPTHWGTVTSVAVPSAFSLGGVVAFRQTAPGRCMYLTGGGGNVGQGGLNVLWAGAQHSDSAPIDISRCAPSPVAGTQYESRGTAFLKASAACTGSAARHCYWLYSHDGRTTGDSNYEDSLELVHQAYYLDADSGDGPKQEESTVDLPLSVTATSAGYVASSTGTLGNIFQYYFNASSSSIEAYAFVRGWKL